jgi:hypothetical protein
MIFCHRRSSFVVGTRTIMPVDPKDDATPAPTSPFGRFSAANALPSSCTSSREKDGQARERLGKRARNFDRIRGDPRPPIWHFARREGNERLQMAKLVFRHLVAIQPLAVRHDHLGFERGVRLGALQQGRPKALQRQPDIVGRRRRRLIRLQSGPNESGGRNYP